MSEPTVPAPVVAAALQQQWHLLNPDRHGCRRFDAAANQYVAISDDRLLQEIKAEVVAWYGLDEATMPYLLEIKKQLELDSYACMDGAPLFDLTVGMPLVDMVAFQNGWLDLATGAFTPPKPEWYAASARPYAFDRAARCPVWDQVRSEAVQPEFSDLLQEWFGYNLVPDVAHRKMLIGFGPTASGKGLTADALLGVIGDDGCGHVPAERIGSKFAGWELVGKLANIAHDASGHVGRSATAWLKAAVSGDPLRVEQKFRPAINVRISARFTFFSNGQLTFADRSSATRDRLLLVPFPNAVPAHRRDLTLKAKLLAELPGIFVWALAGLRRLRQQGGFSIPPKMHELLDEWEGESNPAAAFCRESLKIDPKAWTSSEKINTEYTEWCKGERCRPLGSNAFGKVLAEVFRPEMQAGIVRRTREPEELRKRRGLKAGGKRAWGYSGLVIEERSDRRAPTDNLPLAVEQRVRQLRDEGVGRADSLQQAWDEYDKKQAEIKAGYQARDAMRERRRRQDEEDQAVGKAVREAPREVRRAVEKEILGSPSERGGPVPSPPSRSSVELKKEKERDREEKERAEKERITAYIAAATPEPVEDGPEIEDLIRQLTEDDAHDAHHPGNGHADGPGPDAGTVERPAGGALPLPA